MNARSIAKALTVRWILKAVQLGTTPGNLIARKNMATFAEISSLPFGWPLASHKPYISALDLGSAAPANFDDVRDDVHIDLTVRWNNAANSWPRIEVTSRSTIYLTPARYT
jgi:hypothetical protein